MGTPELPSLPNKSSVFRHSDRRVSMRSLLARELATDSLSTKLYLFNQPFAARLGAYCTTNDEMVGYLRHFETIRDSTIQQTIGGERYIYSVPEDEVFAFLIINLHSSKDTKPEFLLHYFIDKKLENGRANLRC